VDASIGLSSRRNQSSRTFGFLTGFPKVVNDGAFGPMGEGSGLAGLAERARALADTKLIDIELVRMLRSRSPNARPALRR
jgi:hypothetical protein